MQVRRLHRQSKLRRRGARCQSTSPSVRLDAEMQMRVRALDRIYYALARLSASEIQGVCSKCVLNASRGSGSGSGSAGWTCSGKVEESRGLAKRERLDAETSHD